MEKPSLGLTNGDTNEGDFQEEEGHWVTLGEQLVVVNLRSEPKRGQTTATEKLVSFGAQKHQSIIRKNC